jgi:hypothetical protein
MGMDGATAARHLKRIFTDHRHRGSDGLFLSGFFLRNADLRQVANSSGQRHSAGALRFAANIRR